MKNFTLKPIHPVRWLILSVALILVVSSLGGCSGTKSSQTNLNKMAPMSDMPSEIQKAPTIVQESYQFAVANPEALKNVPCYCGCGAVGHTSNYSCYVQEVKTSGEIVFDQHALGCTLCVDISQDVIRLTNEGKTPQEIRGAIDQTYSQYGPSNMEALQ
jgi:hypothetical protein